MDEARVRLERNVYEVRGEEVMKAYVCCPYPYRVGLFRSIYIYGSGFEKTLEFVLFRRHFVIEWGGSK